MSRLLPVIPRGGWLLLWVYLLTTLVGLVAFIRRDRPPALTPALLPSRNLAPGALVQAARFDEGARVRASTYDAFRRHHPLFAIDGEPHPTLVEKWVSAPRDRAPWIEVLLGRPTDVERVVLFFLTAEDHELPVQRYSLRCFASAAAPIAQLQIEGNRDRARDHALACRSARVIRVDFGLEPSGPQQVRLFELEVWGRR